MGVRERVSKHVIDGGIVIAIACGLLVAQQHGCFESRSGPSADERKLPPCPDNDPWRTGCEHR